MSTIARPLENGLYKHISLKQIVTLYQYLNYIISVYTNKEAA